MVDVEVPIPIRFMSRMTAVIQLEQKVVSLEQKIVELEYSPLPGSKYLEAMERFGTNVSVNNN